MVSDVIRRFGSVAECRDVLSGIVGEGPAIELQKFARQAVQEATLRALVLHPATASLPHGLDDLYVVTSWFAANGKEKGVAQAAAVLLSRLPPEFAVVLARDMLKTNTAFVREPGYKDFLKQHGKLLVA